MQQTVKTYFRSQVDINDQQKQKYSVTFSQADSNSKVSETIGKLILQENQNVTVVNYGGIKSGRTQLMLDEQDGLMYKIGLMVNYPLRVRMFEFFCDQTYDLATGQETKDPIFTEIENAATYRFFIDKAYEIKKIRNNLNQMTLISHLVLEIVGEHRLVICDLAAPTRNNTNWSEETSKLCIFVNKSWMALKQGLRTGMKVSDSILTKYLWSLPSQMHVIFTSDSYSEVFQ